MGVCRVVEKDSRQGNRLRITGWWRPGEPTKSNRRKKSEARKITVQPPVPQPLPPVRKKSRATPFLISGGIVLFLALIIGGLVLVAQFISEQGITEPMDRTFGDQNLKSTVALLELHKLRYGKYPDTLKDIKFTGQWDQIYLSGVSYYPSEDRESYYVEVHRGWVGKPTLDMPDEFWQNTGYDESLKPKDE